ncbi:MAG TPA: thioesterase family protein [candidate division Zixibacteria bacterium]|nr:thioesterase family protein [candidate division Zixibacteria bacterium]
MSEDDFRHRASLEVRFRDVDAFGHVNNAVVSTYVEQARVRYLHEILGVDPVGNMPLILAMIKVDYLAPIFWGDRVEVGSRVDWIGRTSLAMSHRLSAGEDRQLARASSVLVAYDYEQARPMPVPDAWRAALVAHEGRDLTRPSQGAT